MFKLMKKAVSSTNYGKVQLTFCSKCWEDVKMLIDKVKEKWGAK